MIKHPKRYLLITFKNKYFKISTQWSTVLIARASVPPVPTISFTSVGYLDDNTCHAECTVQFWWTETSKAFKECTLHWVGNRLMKIHDSATTILTKALLIYISDCAHYKSMSSLDEQSLLSTVSVHSHSPSPPLSPSGFIRIIMMSMTYGTTLSLSKYSFQIFSKCFQYPCWMSFVTSHTNSFITCSNFWRCILAVMFSCVSLFNLSSSELYRFRSHVWRQSNCMTMSSQYAINSVYISFSLCGRINW